MASRKLSISISPELDQALRALATQRGEDLSRLIELLLRENPLLTAAIARLRGPALEGDWKKGRSLEKLVVLGRTVDALWRQRLASGKVKLLGPVEE